MLQSFVLLLAGLLHKSHTTITTLVLFSAHMNVHVLQNGRTILQHRSAYVTLKSTIAVITLQMNDQQFSILKRMIAQRTMHKHLIAIDVKMFGMYHFLMRRHACVRLETFATVRTQIWLFVRMDLNVQAKAQFVLKPFATNVAFEGTLLKVTGMMDFHVAFGAKLSIAMGTWETQRMYRPQMVQ